MPDAADNKVRRTNAWLDEELIKQAKAVAADEDTTATEVLEGILRAPLKQRYRRMIERAHRRELGEAGA